MDLLQHLLQSSVTESSSDMFEASTRGAKTRRHLEVCPLRTSLAQQCC